MVMDCFSVDALPDSLSKVIQSDLDSIRQSRVDISEMLSDFVPEASKEIEVGLNESLGCRSASSPLYLIRVKLPEPSIVTLAPSAPT